MGGYAFYVWSSFGVTALVVLAEIWQVRAKRRAVLQSLRDEFADTQAREGEQA